MADFIYAVRVGSVPGLYPTWDKCKEVVDGYPGAVYKKFHTTDEEGIRKFMENRYVYEDYLSVRNASTGTSFAIPTNTWTAYTDGSYNPETHACGSGLVMLHDGKEETFTYLNTDKEAESMRNVTGEILAAMKAIDMALAAGASRLLIRHDYTGISEWGNDHWQAKNKYTQAYKAHVFNARKKMEIQFEHVSAHTGEKYNEMADQLAKSAAGL